MNFLNRCRSIKDGVHRTITLTAEEMAVIDHPLFQRLREIHQTGLLYLVAPTATHRRFMHSIGVLQMAQRLFDALGRGSEAAQAKLYPVSEAGVGDAVRFSTFPEEVLRQVQRTLRLAALVHDLGHGPLSHAFDTFAPKRTDVARFLSDPRLASIAAHAQVLLEGKDGLLRHEAVSCILFATIWSELEAAQKIGPDASWMPAAVAAILLNTSPSTTVPEMLRPFVPFIRDLVASAPVDADRMDYLLRDSQAFGVTYGQYEPDRILKSALCARGQDDTDGRPTYRVGWRQSGMSAIVQFVFARFFMFQQMYGHKTYRGFELMLKRIAEVARERGIAFVNAQTLDEFTEQYERFSDDAFLRTLSGEMPSLVALPKEITVLTRRIRMRHPWKRVYEFQEDLWGKEEALLEALRASAPATKLILDIRPINAMKDLEHGSRVYRLDPTGRYSRRASRLTGERSWVSESRLLEGLKDQRLARIYLQSDGTSEDRLRYHALRKRAVEIASEILLQTW